MKGMSFEEAFKRAIERGLSALGEGTKLVVYYYLEHLYGLKKEDMVKDPGRLEEGLDGIFKAGSEVLKGYIIDALYDELGIERPEGIESFIELVREAKKRYKVSPVA